MVWYLYTLSLLQSKNQLQYPEFWTKQSFAAFAAEFGFRFSVHATLK